MKLVLARHALAMDRAEFAKTGADDSLRPLVHKGKERMRQVGEWLYREGPLFDLLVTSPFLRTLQSAETLSKALKVTNLFKTESLQPGSKPQAFAQWLKVHGEECEAILVVGHDPHLSFFASWLLAGAKESFIDLKKSGLICIEVESFHNIEPASGKLVYHLNSKMIV